MAVSERHTMFLECELKFNNKATADNGLLTTPCDAWCIARKAFEGGFFLQMGPIPGGVCMLQVQPSTVHESTKPAQTKVSKTR